MLEIEKYIVSPQCTAMLRNMVHAQEVEDYRQDLAVVLLGKKTEIDSIHFFSIGVVKNLRYQKKLREARLRTAPVVDFIEEHGGDEINVAAAWDVLLKKNDTQFGRHEVKLFVSHQELGSCREVAKFYDIPEYYVNQVVRRVRDELKKAIKKTL